MVKILVVDDSPVERRLAGAILERNLAEAVIVSAENGHEALRELARSDIDLVLTDLMMPGLSGLELVEEMQAAGWNVPVILMTGFGSEDIAAQALLAGASSYVPKRALVKYLVQTVKSVLSVVQTRQRPTTKPAGLIELESHFSLDNDIGRATGVVEYLVSQLRFLASYDETQITHVGIALQEALSNAIYHGNLELSSDLRQNDDGKYLQLADERRRQPPFASRRVVVHSTAARDQVRFVIRDEGPGFDVVRALAASAETDNFDLVSGRGMLLIRSFMDTVTHNSAGNEVTLIKRARAGQEGTAASSGASTSLAAPSAN
jgi:CheY-like chemotaxis protein/anti-sigma regulatory factor (Ser/Thr protein kinase)